MKKILIIIFVFFSIISCKKIENLTKFELIYEFDLVIPENVYANTLVHLEEKPITISSEEFLRFNTSKDLLEKVYLKHLNIIIDSTSDNFDFLSTINVYIQSENLPKVRIAWKEHFPDGFNRLELETLNDNILPYLKKDNFVILIDIITVQDLDYSIPVTVSSSFEIEAKVFEN